jgi:hypothetical protein
MSQALSSTNLAIPALDRSRRWPMNVCSAGDHDYGRRRLLLAQLVLDLLTAVAHGFCSRFHGILAGACLPGLILDFVILSAGNLGTILAAAARCSTVRHVSLPVCCFGHTQRPETLAVQPPR